MQLSRQWSKMVGSPLSKPQDKLRVFETNEGFLITAVTDATDDDAFERFFMLMTENARVFDLCKTQNEVYKHEKLVNKLAKQAGIINT